MALAGSGILALCVGALLGYWILEGKRRLAQELEALRSSGAPEFPEQIIFAPRPAGEDPRAWWKAIDEAEQAEWSIEQLPACAARLAAGESAGEIEAAQLAGLRDPRRVGSLSDCELAVLRQRVARDRPALELAMQVEQFAPYDWQAALQTPAGSLEARAPSPRISAYITSVRVLCAQAVRCAVDGDSANAELCLRRARRATELVGGARDILTCMAKTAALRIWIDEGVLPLLQLLPADVDWTEVDSSLAVLDLPAEFQAACIGERAMGNGIYRQFRDSSGIGMASLPTQWAEARMVKTFIDRDQATYLEWMRKTITTSVERESVGPWRKLEGEFEAVVQSRRTLIDGVIWVMAIPRLPAAGRFSLGGQVRIHLVRAALIARRNGADAARAWLANFRDPFNGELLRTRLDPDGILAMWSVGEDGKDDPPLAQRATGKPGDDILVEVRVP